MRDEIHSSLERAKLPPLSFDLLHKLGDPNCDLDSVADSISLDPSLTAGLLRICNSAVFGTSEPISTVAEAIGRAGFKTVYMLAAALYGNNCYSGFASSRLDSRQLWQHSVTTAFNTKFVAESAGLDASFLFTAGLLHDIGKVILAQSSIADGCNFYDPANASSLRRESDIFGATHAEVGAALLEKWKLPSELVTSVRHHHHPAESVEFHKSVAAVTIGNVVSHAADHPEIIASEEYADAFFILDLNPGYLKLWREQFDESNKLVAALGGFGESPAGQPELQNINN